VTRPVGSPIDEGGDAPTIVDRFRTIATTLGVLHEKHRFLHRDISYLNLVISPGGPRIIDWHTLESTLEDKVVSGFHRLEGAASYALCSFLSEGAHVKPSSRV
jgi:serine/threonine protein kinase